MKVKTFVKEQQVSLRDERQAACKASREAEREIKER